MTDEIKLVAPAERPHHPFSPSKLQFLEASPNYISEQRANNVAAEAGTKQHDATDGHIHIDDPDLSDREAEAVAMCKSFRDGIIAKYPGGTLLTEVYLPIDERKLVFKGVTYEGTTAGYVDLAVVSADGKSAEVCDWKFGAWSVEPAENNLQGIAYLLGLLNRFPAIESCVVSFAMPHREEISTHTFFKKEFEKLYLRVMAVVHRALHAQTSGDFDFCKVLSPCCLFCGNKGVCTKLSEFALSVARKYNPLVVPENVVPSLLSDQKHSSKTMEIAQLMETWGKAMRSQITARTIEDDCWLPDNYQLRKRVDCEIVNKDKVIEFAKKAGVTEAQIEGARKLVMTPLNKAISDLAPRGSKKEAMKNFKTTLLEDGCLVEEQPIYFLERNKA